MVSTSEVSLRCLISIHMTSVPVQTHSPSHVSYSNPYWKMTSQYTPRCIHHVTWSCHPIKSLVAIYYLYKRYRIPFLTCYSKILSFPLSESYPHNFLESCPIRSDYVSTVWSNWTVCKAEQNIHFLTSETMLLLLLRGGLPPLLTKSSPSFNTQLNSLFPFVLVLSLVLLKIITKLNTDQPFSHNGWTHTHTQTVYQWTSDPLEFGNRNIEANCLRIERTKISM